MLEVGHRGVPITKMLFGPDPRNEQVIHLANASFPALRSDAVRKEELDLRGRLYPDELLTLAHVVSAAKTVAETGGRVLVDDATGLVLDRLGRVLKYLSDAYPYAFRPDAQSELKLLQTIWRTIHENDVKVVDSFDLEATEKLNAIKENYLLKLNEARGPRARGWWSGELELWSPGSSDGGVAVLPEFEDPIGYDSDWQAVQPIRGTAVDAAELAKVLFLNPLVIELNGDRREYRLLSELRNSYQQPLIFNSVYFEPLADAYPPPPGYPSVALRETADGVLPEGRVRPAAFMQLHGNSDGATGDWDVLFSLGTFRRALDGFVNSVERGEISRRSYFFGLLQAVIEQRFPAEDVHIESVRCEHRRCGSTSTLPHDPVFMLTTSHGSLGIVFGLDLCSLRVTYQIYGRSHSNE